MGPAADVCSLGRLSHQFVAAALAADLYRGQGVQGEQSFGHLRIVWDVCQRHGPS